MKINHAMKLLLQKYLILNRINEVKLEPGLKRILSEGVIELHGCYLLKDLIPDGFNIDKANQTLQDQTGIECLINHIHIGDYFDELMVTDMLIVEEGIKYAFSLQDLLPKRIKFEIILGCSFDPIFDCYVRFHKLRQGEEWLQNDLEKYEEALLVLD